VRAYDGRTGKQLWEFSAMPPVGDPLRASWGAGSAEIGGDMGSWGQMSADDKLGYVYVAFTAPNLPGWGGWRPGDNLYSESLIALDAKTGRKIWHYQMIHHDVWDRDAASPPVLGDVTVDDRRIKAVMQTGKFGLLFAFDRTNGKPLWPIEERPVPASDIPGEHLSPTQPFPTKPPPLDHAGISEDDLIDFTPALRKQALDIVKDYRMGPLYAPPSTFSNKPGETRGTIMMPGTHGGGSHNTGAFDPETGTYYAVTHSIPGIMAVERPTDPTATVDWVFHFEPLTWDLKGPQGLPLIKPPYGRITAIDMNKGENRWVVANGDGPRNHPALKDLNLPPLGVPGRPAVVVTKRLLFVGEGSDAMNFSDLTGGFGTAFRAYDKLTGAVLAKVDLPSGTSGAPITYAVDGKQYVVVAVGGKRDAPQWVALGF
jgi:quinoprotein glucose dehydrogenase